MRPTVSPTAGASGAPTAANSGRASRQRILAQEMPRQAPPARQARPGQIADDVQDTDVVGRLIDRKV